MPRKKINAKDLRNLITALVNGAITLVILLIAPLGLAAVITNTILVMIASFFSGHLTEVVMDFLSTAELDEIDVEPLPEQERRSGSEAKRAIQPQSDPELLPGDED